MTRGLHERLEEGERPLWMRLPRGRLYRGGLRAVQICGHLLLTAVSVLFASVVYVPVPAKIVLGVILVAATNAPLVVWAVRRWPTVAGGGQSIYFVTDRRVGLLRPGGELCQVPICPELELDVRGGVMRFSVGDGTPVSFAGLGRNESGVVQLLVEQLREQCRSSEEGPAAAD